jgi:glycosyltransferase involved in cell wall biosynthesis
LFYILKNGMNKLPVLSVIVITYNQVDLLKKTIDSITNQVTGFFFEIIVTDDCSTDLTQAYCETVPSTDAYDFKYVRTHRNGGITANCNFGMSKAIGKYIALIGGDDLFLPGKIEKHVTYMESNPSVSISYHPVDIFKSDTNETLFHTNQTRADTPLSCLEVIQMCIPGAVSVVVRSSALPSGFFDVRLPTVSDWLFYIEVAAKGDVGFFQHTLARYRKHGNQASFRTYELLAESLRNLDLAKEKLSDYPGIDEAVAKGKSRYLFGEAYRQLMEGHGDRARQLVYRGMSHGRSMPAYGLLVLTFLGAPAVALARILKTFIKKFV